MADGRVEDDAVVYNVATQFMIGGVLIVVFVLVRPLMLWLYSPNTKGKRCHPGYNFAGRLNWLLPVLRTSDTELLSLVGMDLFMIAQITKLLYRILVVASVVFIPVLCPLYFVLSKDSRRTNGHILPRLSVLNIDAGGHAIPVASSLTCLATIITLYMMYVFYRRYVGLRQEFIRNPVILTAIPTLKKVQYEYGSAELAFEYTNLTKYTVLFTRLPKGLQSDGDLRAFVEKLGLENVVDCLLIKEVSNLEKLVKRRRDVIERFEAEAQRIVSEMNRFSRRNSEGCAASFGRTFKTDLFSTALKEYKWSECSTSRGDYEDRGESHAWRWRARKHSAIDVKKRADLFAHFMSGFNAFKRKKGGQAVIDRCMAELREVCELINREKEKMTGNERTRNMAEIVRIIDREGDAIFNLKSFDREFITISDFLSAEDITLGALHRFNAGFVTFKSQKTASLICQSILSSNFLSYSGARACAPRDVVWKNLLIHPFCVYARRFAGLAMFVAFNFMFSTVGFALSSAIRIEWIEQMLNLEIPVHVKSATKGVIAPLVYNTLLALAPILIEMISQFERALSVSKLNVKLMNRNFIFLFFNGFIAIFFSSTIISIIPDFARGEGSIGTVFQAFGEAVSDTAQFFTNFIIQKAIVGNILLLTKPGGMLVSLIARVISWNKTRRKEIESRLTSSVNIAKLYPPLMLVLPICLVYAPIFPPILGVGVIHFMALYFVLKSEFIYSSFNDHETGGIHWMTCVDQIFLSLLAMHMTVVSIALIHKKRTCVAMTVALVAFVVCAWVKMKSLFYKQSNFHPINVTEENRLDSFIVKFINRRYKTYQAWTDVVDDVDCDSIDIKDMGISVYESKAKKYPYRNGMLMESPCKIILPHGFFVILEYIKNNDTKEVFGYYSK